MSQVTTPPQCVVAIDIGSDGCGYAFSADYQFKNNPCDIYTPRWFPGVGQSSLKVPSAILFDSEQKFVSFGYDAQDQYTDICASNDHNSWYYVEHFKMTLYSAVENGEDIKNDFIIKEMGGKSMSAKHIFSSCIKFLYDHFITFADDRQIGVQKDRIKWILTVPAIWTDSCKQFVRESAIQAGIAGRQFSLVYEPEAASIYARQLHVKKVESEKKQISLETFKPGTKMLVVDAGGGTVDISAQEVLENGGLKIIHKVCGGDYGGRTINAAYRGLLRGLFSGPSLITFKKLYPMDYLEMMRSFEDKKKAFKVSVDQTVTTRIAATLLEIAAKGSDCPVEDIIANSEFATKLRVKRDKLFIDASIFINFFKDSLKNLLTDISNVIKHPRCSDVSAIMLVGGYAECDILQEAVREMFAGVNVIVPTEGGLSVLKGAVIYGHTPHIVTSRICNYTYGIAVSKPFKPNTMPQEKSYWYDKELWCRDIFEISYQMDTVVEIGDKKQIELDDTFLSEEVQCRRKDPLKVEIYISDKERPEFVTDDGCKRHAVITVQPPNGQWPVIVHGYVEFEISGTEMIGSYVNVDTGERTSITIDFLPQPSNFNNPDRRRVYDPDHTNPDRRRVYDPDDTV